MIVKVFRGKNWKLASEKKWDDDQVGALGDQVGTLVLNGEEHLIHLIEGGFAAVQNTKEEPKPRWIANLMGGNKIQWVHAKDEAEARKRLETICNELKTIGTLFSLKEKDRTERVCTFDARPPLKSP